MKSLILSMLATIILFSTKAQVKGDVFVSDTVYVAKVIKGITYERELVETTTFTMNSPEDITMKYANGKTVKVLLKGIVKSTLSQEDGYLYKTFDAIIASPESTVTGIFGFTYDKSGKVVFLGIIGPSTGEGNFIGLIFYISQKPITNGTFNSAK